MAQRLALQLLIVRAACEVVLLLDPFTLVLPSASIPDASTPFDSASLRTAVSFTAPSGRVISVLPFYTQDFVRTQGAAGEEVLVNSSSPYFAVRVAPQERGVYTFLQTFAAGAPPPPGVVPLAGNFTCAGGPARAGDGFAAAKNRRFTLDGEASFFLVGENMAWPGCWPYYNGSARYDNASGASYMYDRFLPKLAAAGGNWIRLWAGPSLVRDVAWDGEEGSFLALALAGKARFGEYNLAAAWRIEHVVELARALGIKISLVLEAQQCFRADGAWGFWAACVFNAANGGPIPADTPVGPFGNAAAMAELRQRWLYILSRWGYSTSIFSWELQNEADDWPGGYDAAALNASAALSALIQAHDPYAHMIDNSFGGVASSMGTEHAFEALASTAFTSVHAYNMVDVARTIWDAVTPHVRSVGKPCFLEEFGSDWRGPLQHADDPHGVGMHTGAWASLVGLAAGTAMQWFWAETDSLNTYGRLAGAAALSRRLAPQLLALQWSTWSGALNTSAAAAGWSVGVDARSGALRGVLAWAYNSNYTQGGCGGGCVLALPARIALTLEALPAPAPGAAPVVQFIDTATGDALPGAWSGALAAAAAAAGEMCFTFPHFDRDIAMWVEWAPPAVQQPAPAPPALSFAGYTWAVKTGHAGPGPNDFSAANARVDAAGRLHLAVARDAASGAWSCAEVVLNASLGYGTYAWTLAPPAPVSLDENIVIGLFTYENDSREVDVEFSQWGGAFPGVNADFAVQPATVQRFEAGVGAVRAGYTWGPGFVNFTCGSEAWSHAGADVPPPGAERVHMNAWLDRGRAPATGEGAEVVVADFVFTPL